MYAWPFDMPNLSLDMAATWLQLGCCPQVARSLPAGAANVVPLQA